MQSNLCQQMPMIDSWTATLPKVMSRSDAANEIKNIFF